MEKSTNKLGQRAVQSLRPRSNHISLIVREKAVDLCCQAVDNTRRTAEGHEAGSLWKLFLRLYCVSPSSLPSILAIRGRSAATRRKPHARAVAVENHAESLLLDVPYDGDPAVRSGEGEAENSVRVHRDQIVLSGKRHVGGAPGGAVPLEVEHHGGDLHLRLPVQVVAGVEQRETRRLLQPRCAGLEGVAQGGVCRARQPRDRSPRVDDHPALPRRRVQQEVGGQHAGDSRAADADPRELHVVECVQGGIHDQRRENRTRSGHGRCAEDYDGGGAPCRCRGSAVHQAIGEAAPEAFAHLRGEGEPTTAEPEQAGGGDEETLVVVAAPERHPTDARAAPEGEGLGGELARGDGAVAVGNLVEARTTAAVAAGDVEAAAEEGPAGDGGVRPGLLGVEDGVGLGIALPAGRALEPDHVAAGVEHHVGVGERGADPNPGEVLSATVGEAGDHRTGEASGAGLPPCRVLAPRCGGSSGRRGEGL